MRSLLVLISDIAQINAWLMDRDTPTVRDWVAATFRAIGDQIAEERA